MLALRTFDSKNPLVQEICQRLNSLSLGGKEFTPCWIPSHVGITGNEMADVAAKRAAVRSCTCRFPLPATDFYPTIAAILISNWQETWTQCSDNKLRVIKRTLFPGAPPCAGVCRREEVILCRLRTVHTCDAWLPSLRGRPAQISVVPIGADGEPRVA